MGILHQIEVKVKALQEPDRDRGDEDDGEGLLQKVLGLLPEKLQHAAGTGHAVVGQLHHKGDCLPLEERLLEQKGDQNPDQDPQQVQADHDLPAVIREKGADEKGVDGQLGRAAHKGRQQDGHLPVPLTGQQKNTFSFDTFFLCLFLRMPLYII